eukprot:4293476-Pyramimonas_sp.AAC.1
MQYVQVACDRDAHPVRRVHLVVANVDPLEELIGISLEGHAGAQMPRGREVTAAAALSSGSARSISHSTYLMSESVWAKCINGPLPFPSPGGAFTTNVPCTMADMSHFMVFPLASFGLPRRPLPFPEVRLRPLPVPGNISAH